jgi:hypothetical protein
LTLPRSGFLSGGGGGGAGAGGDVSSSANLDDNAVLRGDGGLKGIQDSGVLLDDTDNLTGILTVTLPNAGLHLLDTNASHDLIVSPGSDLTADHTLTIVTGDADRTLTIAGAASVSGTNTGDVTLAGTPDYITIAGQTITRAKLDPVDDLNTFASSVLAGLLTDETGTDKVVFNTDPVFASTITVPNTGLHVFDTDSSHDLIIKPGSNLTADHTLTVTTGDADRTLTLAGDATISGTNTGDGIGGVTGAVDNAIIRADGVGGATVQALSLVTISDAGAIATTQGVNLSLTATAPTATVGASQAGKTATLTASAAVASTDTNGAAAGGAVTITSGAAARLVSGNANGGDINLTTGAGIGTGTAGVVIVSNGLQSYGTGTYASEGVRVGPSAICLVNSTGQGAVAIGNGANANGTTGYGAVAIGKSTSAQGNGNIAIGNSISATGAPSLAIGGNCTANESTVVGIAAVSAATQSVAVGQNARASGTQSTVVGAYADGNTFTNVTLVGKAVAATKNSQNIFGMTGSVETIINGGLLSTLIVEANTAGSGAPNLLLAGESNSVMTNEGAGAVNYESLPTAVSGYVFEGVVQSANGQRWTASTGDTIRMGGAVSATAGYIQSTTVGDTVRLVSANATEWFATSWTGSWSVV